MHAGRLLGSRFIPGSWKIGAFVALLAFGFSVLDLPVHLVHHLGEVNPDCQLLGFSVALNAISLNGSCIPSLDRPWDALPFPAVSPAVPLLCESAQARGPPPALPS